MLKITIFSAAAATTLKLEGALAGYTLAELENCVKALRASAEARPLRVDISDLIQTSDGGKELLRLMYEGGAHLVAGVGCRRLRAAREPYNVARTEGRLV